MLRLNQGKGDVVFDVEERDEPVEGSKEGSVMAGAKGQKVGPGSCILNRFAGDSKVAFDKARNEEVVKIEM